MKEYIIDYVTKEDIDLIDKLENMLKSEILEYIYDACNLSENFVAIEETIWNLINDKKSKFSKTITYDNLSPGYEEESVEDLYKANLYNCDLLYMTAISMVLGLKIPETSCDISIYGM